MELVVAEPEVLQAEGVNLIEEQSQTAAQIVTDKLFKKFQCCICTVWRFSSDNQQLRLESRAEIHDEFLNLDLVTQQELPLFFRYFDSNTVLVAEAARLHPATSSLNQKHFIPDGVHSVLAFVIEHESQQRSLAVLEFNQPTALSTEQIMAAQEIAANQYATIDNTELAKQELEVETSLELFASAIAHSKQCCMIVDTDSCNVVYCNKAVELFSGRSKHVIVGHSFRSLSTYNQHPQEFEALYNKILHDRQIDGELRVVGKDGLPRWYRYHNNVVDIGGRDYVISLSEDVSSHRRHQEELEYIAWKCQLTGLNNRAKYLSDVASGQLALLLLIDIRGFKVLNDLYGEAVGDMVLNEVGRRINHFCQGLSGSQVYRISADEFVVGFESALPQPVATMASMLGKRLHAEMIHHGQSYRIDTTMAALELGMLSSKITPLAALDMAMVEAKKGRLFQLFDAQVQQTFLDEAELEAELRLAVARRQFVLHFQPLIDVAAGKAIGAEVLIRWQHPRLGLIYPGRFIDIAERTGIIESVGLWVFETGLYQLYLWQRRWPDLQIHVNVSVKQLLAEEFFEICWNQLTRYRVKPGSFVLEITENTLMEDIESVRLLCEQLGELGLVLAIDDFGTGYSSMSYIKQLPVQKLKIDRSFIADLEHSQESRLIVPAIVAMGKALNMRITAEGVENEFQESFLRKHMCDEIQGFYYSKGIPAMSFESYIEQDITRNNA